MMEGGYAPMTNQTKRVLCYATAVLGSHIDLWIIAELAHSAPDAFRSLQWGMEGTSIFVGCFMLCGYARIELSGPDKK